VTKKYDTAVFIGRFNPFHLGHQSVVEKGLEVAERVFIFIGSSFQARDIRNPFTFEERKRMIRAAFPDENKVKIFGIRDYPYNDNKWVNVIQGTVAQHTITDEKICLIGHAKDHSSYYLNIFPNWDGVNVDNFNNINATEIRDTLLGDKPMKAPYFAKMPFASYNEFMQITVSSEFEHMFDEYARVAAYRKSWEVGVATVPYAPTFVTTDAVVTQSGHLLLVKRNASPGKGLWALPGGFLDQQETLLNGAIRELREETKLKVPGPVLKGSIRGQHTFDAPNRSTRGRTITTAFHFDLGFKKDLPPVKGSDDAEKAQWIQFKDVDGERLFEDHASIIDHFLNIF
jgi:bifunctional NMN adenylyltransferase/nudix hydrolase